MIQATRKDAMQLMLQGAIALAEVEAAGLYVDMEYLTATEQKIDAKIDYLTRELHTDAIWAVWKKKYGSKARLSSREQLANIIFVDVLKSKDAKKTKSGRIQADASALEMVDLPFVKTYLQIEKLKKAKSTYLNGIRNNVAPDGRLRTFYNLHIARSFRSSSSDPNFQNLPIRDAVIGKMIRSCFRAPPGHVLVEVDFSGIEVCISACYNRDPKLIEYIKDDTKDMHRDMAAQCFMAKPKEITKMMRYCGKNMFVFPQFYGDYYLNCSRSLWEAIDKHKLEYADGSSIMDRLKAAGIKRLGDQEPKEKPRPGTFEYHIKEVEKDFWGRRFKIYSDWKTKWWDSYLKTGKFQMFTGFEVSGVMTRNEVINYPVQGSAFHCLLWSLIQTVRELKQRKIAARIVGQIHDSMLAYVRADALDDFLKLVKEIMTERLLEEWEWIIVPLSIEAEVSPIAGSWHEKKEVKIP